MTPQELVKQYPVRRIKPYDGMIVTADVWEEAHDYHVRQQRYHTLLNHGAGIVTGLQVIASDPPDNSVYILPGIALDSLGQTIILPEPFAYDLGAAQGTLYLLLTYGESQPRPDDRASPSGQTDGMLYIYSHYGLEAGGAPPDPTGPYVELARVRRSAPAAPITDAPDPMLPGPNQIDLRFRRSIGASLQNVASLAVCYLGGGASEREGARKHGRGASWMARAVRQTDGMQVWVDNDVPLAPGSDLSGYTLVYLVGQGRFQFSPDAMNVVYAYLQGGGTLLIESCRQEPKGAEAADAAFLDMLSSFGIKLDDLPAGHTLLAEPNLFTAPPAGFESDGRPGIRLGDGVILCSADYGCLWQGERRDKPALREEIRAAHEWGGNILAYALGRRTARRK